MGKKRKWNGNYEEKIVMGVKRLTCNHERKKSREGRNEERRRVGGKEEREE